MELIDVGYTEAFGAGFVAGMVFGMSVVQKAVDAVKAKKVKKAKAKEGSET